jgi:hypothetical protein
MEAMVEMDRIVKNFFSHPVFNRRPQLCDYIAHLVKCNLKAEDAADSKLLSSVGNIMYDLGEEGELRSTAKKIFVEDRNGQKYLITVEAV